MKERANVHHERSTNTTQHFTHSKQSIFHFDMVLCEVCGKHESKYRCPGCSMCSCCAECVMEHKRTKGCNGKRQRTAFVERQGMSAGMLRSDLRFLEDVARESEQAKRRRIGGRGRDRLSRRTQLLLAAAKKRDVKVLLLPPGMSRRQANSSFFDKKEDVVLWHIEWLREGFSPKESPQLHSENVTIQEAFQACFPSDAPEKFVLHAKDGKFDFVRSTTLKNCLKGHEIVEFPAFSFK